MPPPAPFGSADDAYAWLGDWHPDEFSVEEADRAVRAEHAVATQLDRLHPEVRGLFDRVPPYGEVADWIGIEAVYRICAFLPAIGLLAWFLPKVEHRRG